MHTEGLFYSFREQKIVSQHSLKFRPTLTLGWVARIILKMSNHQNYNLSKNTGYADCFVTICTSVNIEKIFVTILNVHFLWEKARKKFSMKKTHL